MLMHKPYFQKFEPEQALFSKITIKFTNPSQGINLPRKPMNTINFKKKGRKEVWGSLMFWGLKEKMQGKGIKRKELTQKNIAEKKAQGNSFCFVA